MMIFPVLTLDSVRKAIAGRDEFIEANRGDHIIFNYNVSFPDSFDCPIRRECRGLIFSPEGKVIARRFHKFFNLNEKEETLEHTIFSRMTDENYTILSKLDGSMITPIPLDNGNVIRWGTKMGITEVALQAEAFVANNRLSNYTQLAKECYKANLTPIFEYVGPNNRIVLPYENEDLVLLAVRNNISGAYMSHIAISELIANAYNVPVVPVKSKWTKFEEIRNLVDEEGIVIAFEDGTRIKVKSDWYVAIHKTKDNLLQEKNVIQLVLEDKVDDVIPFLMDADKNKLCEYSNALMHSIVDQSKFMYNAAITIKNAGIDRKTFAMSETKSFHPMVVSFIFKFWGKDVTTNDTFAFIKDQVKQRANSTSNVEELRRWLNFKVW